MKKTGLIIISLLFSLPGMAQEKKDDFSNFMKEELEGFDRFIDDANKDFINFMRDPWKQLKAEKPVEKRTKPEPVKPIVYDEKTTPKDTKPVRLNIQEILDLSTSEGKQKPIVKVKDVDQITFDEPVVIIKKKKEPTIITVTERVVEKPVLTPEPEPKPIIKEEKPKPVIEDKKPVIEEQQPAIEDKKPVIEKQQPIIEDKKPAAKEEQPAMETPKPVLPSAQSSPLYAGSADRSKIVYGGQTFYLSNALNRKCKLSSLNENAIADAYEILCSTNYKPLLKDLQQIKNDMKLNDWGAFTLVKSVADAYCATTNESVVMQQFLLNELGYKARMARKANENKMVLFVAPDCQIYGHIYTVQNGQKYYDLSSTRPYQFYMCQKDSPKAKSSMNMYLSTSPDFAGSVSTSTHQAKGSAAKVTVDIPKSLMDFYKSYPQCDYGVYAKASVNKEVEETLLSSLAPYVQGKGEAEAANVLINFVQTAFQYERDEQQFGYEKPFFVEELFYYPYSDCEDRAVLFAYLVQKLIGLEVVFLDYPDHIATAVRFNENVGGDYLMIGNRKYTVCDPTYIGASIGMTMPQFKNVSAKVLKY